MIVVRVELWSAITGQRTELARMRICNDGTGDLKLRHYEGETFVGRNATALDRGTVQRKGSVSNWRSNDWHIWNLVAAMLGQMGYVDKRAPK